DILDAEKMVQSHVNESDVHILVQSFNDLQTYYSLTINSASELEGCSCPYFLEDGAVCKHLYLAAR
ncbi:hypothetical protein BT69DRAFT_1186200, partial [Atractiella rhizophila]